MKLIQLIFSATLMAMNATAAVNLDITGEQLYEQKCGRCHNPVDPSSFSAREWPGVLGKMRSKAGLDREDERQLLNYLQHDETELAESRPLVREVEQSPKESTPIPDPHKPELGGYLYTEYINAQDHVKNFDLHYLAFSVSGWLNPHVQYLAEFELEHGGTGDNTFVEQAWMDIWFNRQNGLRIGAILTPFNRFDEFHEPLLNPQITRPRASREIGVSAWKDVGVQFHSYGRFTSSLAWGADVFAINGLGAGANLRSSRQYRDNNEDPSIGSRLVLVIQDNLELGVSAVQGPWDDAGDSDLTLLGAHLLYRSGSWRFHGEIMEATSQNANIPASPSTPTQSQSDGDISGWFLQASHTWNNKWQSTVRIGGLDYLDPGVLSGRDTSKGNRDEQEYSLGLSYKPWTDVLFKAEYQWIEEGNRIINTDNNQFALQAALAF